MKKKILGLLIALGLSVPTFASITVSPTRLEINANKARNNYVSVSVEVRGDSQKAVRYRAYSGYFAVADNGKMVIDASDTNNPHNIAKKVRFVPSEFTVPAGKTQRVRVNIADIKSLPDGESRAIIYLEDVNPKEMNVPNNYGIGAQLILKTRVGVPVYVDKGKFTRHGEIETFEIVKKSDGLYTKTKLISDGNTRLRYTGKIQIVSGKKLIEEYSMDGGVVGEGTSSTFEQKIKTDKIKEAGEYTIKAIISYFDENGNKKNIKKDAILQIKGEI